MKKGFLAALAVCAVGAFIGWLSGYNFDHRSADVAFYAGCLLWIAAAIGFAVGVNT